MSHVRPQTDLGSPDRLGLTLFLALALHAIVILGVGFAPPSPPERERFPTLDVLLVHSEGEQPPEQADALAQANQSGSGQMKEAVRPAGPLPNPLPQTRQGEALLERVPGAPPAPEAAPARSVLTAERPSPRPTPAPPPEPTPRPRELPSAAELVARSHEFARHIAEIRQRPEANATEERHAYVSAANTKAYDYAMYENAWRDKVERIGNLNYPDEAKRAGISGTLELDVAINPDGSVRAVTLRRSSGHKVLDDGAVRIVEMAAPFAPFPATMRNKVDVLHIIRQWQFQSGSLATGGR